MKKICLLLALILIFSSIPMSFADENIPNIDEVINLIDDYFALRQESFDTVYSVSEIKKQEILINVADSLIQDEKIREQKLKAVEDKLKVKIVDSKTSAFIENINTVGNETFVDVYEWINFDYIGDSGFVDTAGYGTHHKIRVGTDNKNKELFIFEDIYNEGPLTEMYSTSYKSTIVDTEKSEVISGIIDEEELVNQQFEITPLSIISFTYNRTAVVNYANSYVFNGVTGAYNDNYINYNDDGGDCTNYVSQCISQSLPQLKKSSHSYTSTAWWYENNGTSTNLDDYANSAWVGADAQKTALKAFYGTEKVAPTNADIIKGNPIYVDWHYSSGTPDYNHSYLCVGTNSSGVPIINSHNTDFYHVPWKIGYTDSYYSTLKIYDNINIDSSQL